MAASKPQRPAKSSRSSQDYSQAIKKAVTYSSDSVLAAALSPKITAAHPKIFIADLAPKYNRMLLEGAINLGDEVSAEKVSRCAFEVEEFSLFEESLLKLCLGLGRVLASRIS